MAYVLIVLSIILVISFSTISVNESQTRSAIATDESVVAFFLAESGAEVLLDRIYSGDYDSGALDNLHSGCSNGVFTESLSSGTWTASFFDSDGDQLTSCSNTSWRNEVNEMKVDGNHSSTLRSIRMSIEPQIATGACMDNFGDLEVSIPGKTEGGPSPVVLTVTSFGAGVDFSGRDCIGTGNVSVGGTDYTITATGTFPSGTTSDSGGGNCTATNSQSIGGDTYTIEVTGTVLPDGSGADVQGEVTASCE